MSWHLGGCVCGISSLFLLYPYFTPLLESQTISTVGFIIISTIPGYFIFGFLVIIGKKFGIDFPKDIICLKQLLNEVRDEYERFDWKNTRIGYYIGRFMKIIYRGFLRVFQILIIIFSYFSMIFVVIAFILLIYFLFQVFTSLEQAFLLIVFSFVLLISFFVIIKILVYLQLLLSKILPVFVIHIALGIDEKYFPIQAKSRENNRFSSPENDQLALIEYWQPIIELSYFILASFYSLHILLRVDVISSTILAVLFSVNFLFLFWVFEDLNFSIGQETTITSLLNLIKVFRFSKRSIQLISLYSIGKWLLESQESIQENIIYQQLNFPVISFFRDLLGGIYVLIMFLSLLNIFSWIYLKNLRSRYEKTLHSIENKIIHKIKTINDSLT